MSLRIGLLRGSGTRFSISRNGPKTRSFRSGASAQSRLLHEHATGRRNMQGTIAMLMALSGLGCHHKSSGPVIVDSCYSSCHSTCYSSCYSSMPQATTVVVASSQCYGSGYATVTPSCYSSSCYSACYSSGHSSCYNGGHLRRGLFSCFGHKRRAVDNCGNLGRLRRATRHRSTAAIPRPIRAAKVWSGVLPRA